MTNSKFRPAPRMTERTDSNMRSCPVPGHGQFHAFKTEQFDGTWKDSTCPRCHWEGYRNSPMDTPAYQAARAEEDDRRLNADLLATAITPRFRGCTFDNFRTDGGDSAKVRALNTCRKYAENFREHYQAGRALALLGEIGNGKTHLACAILQHIVRIERATGLIVTAEAITQAVSDSFRNNSGPSKSDRLQELAEVDLLVIDEVGMHTPRPGKDFTPGLLHEVIDRRYQLVLPTVLVSNQTRERLPEFIGPRAADRLRENGGLMAAFTWKSARVGGEA